MNGMAWLLTEDVAEFLAAAGDSLRRDRARNTVILTVAEQVRVNPAFYARSAPQFGWRPGRPGGAFLLTPPFPLLLTGVDPAAAAELAAALAGRPLSGVNGPQEAARAFAAAWTASAGGPASGSGPASGQGPASGSGPAQVLRRERLYRLAGLTRPDPAAAGAPRVATDADAALLTRWLGEFHREAGGVDSGDHAAAVRDRLSYGGFTLWQTADGPVAMAGLSRAVARMARVGPVYTPPALRGRGYASALTAAVSQQALDAGTEEVVLFTDLANPVSNSIYQRIGYRPVEDRVVLALPPA
jgi:RimJ/RimL family protein N-acetyltransferase